MERWESWGRREARDAERWEYLTTVLTADAETAEARDYLQGRYSGRSFPKYAPESLIPELNRLGNEGWELVSLEPVFVGKNGDLMMPTGQQLGPGTTYYTRQYLGVFKRRA